jgi:prevent-host-death family protein
MSFSEPWSAAMAVFSSTDWNRKSGDIFAAARRGPVTITQRKRPAFVVMDYEEFQRLQSGDTRRSYTIDTLPDEIFKLAKAELERMEAEDQVEP